MSPWPPCHYSNSLTVWVTPLGGTPISHLEACLSLSLSLCTCVFVCVSLSILLSICLKALLFALFIFFSFFFISLLLNTFFMWMVLLVCSVQFPVTNRLPGLIMLMCWSTWFPKQVQTTLLYSSFCTISSIIL